MKCLKRSLVLFIPCFLFCREIQAQVVIALLFGEKLNTGKLEFGIVVSPVFTDISKLGGKSRPGLSLSLYFTIKTDSRFSFQIEAIGKGVFGARNIPPYSTGNDSLDHFFSEGSVERKIQTFGLPLLTRYRITGLLFAEGGIQTNLIFKARDIFKTEIEDEELEYTIKTTEKINRLDFGVAGGLFYKFRKDRTSMGIGLRYYYGLTDTETHLIDMQRNTAWMVNLTIPIGAGKSNMAKAN